MEIESLSLEPNEYHFTEADEIVRTQFKTVAKLVADQPQRLEVKMRKGENVTYYDIYCAGSDKGILIGRSGVMAQALRTVLHSLASKKKIRASLNIVE